MLMGGVVVEHCADQLTGGNLTLDALRKRMNSLVAVALHAAPDHSAVEHAERGEQRWCRAVCNRASWSAAPGLDRQSGLGAVERLDLALFVNRQHHSVGWRIDVALSPQA